MKIKNLRKTIYILTEGKTEEAYYSRIGELIDSDSDLEFWIKVEVRVIKDGDKTDPIGLIEEAITARKVNGYDEAWVVFDRDRERDKEIDSATILANENNISIAFSSISFEHWILLHYERNIFAFERSDCESRRDVCDCDGEKCVSKYIIMHFYPKFKKGYSLLYDDLKELEKDALMNAAWLRLIQFSNSSNNNKYILNPYTDNDLLISKLLNYKTHIYLKIGDSISDKELIIKVLDITKENKDIKIIIELDNKRSTSYIINTHTKFYLAHNKGVITNFKIEKSIQIHPNEKHKVILLFDLEKEISNLKLIYENDTNYWIIDIP